MEFREREGISFEEAERRHAELKRRYDAGQIGEEEFDAGRQRLVVRDEEGRSWAMSRQSGRWLYHDGNNAWVEATPPAGPLAPPLPSPDGRGIALEKIPSQDSPQRPAEHHDAVSTPRRDPEEAGASPVSPTTPGEGRSGASSEGDAGRRKKAPLVLALGAAGFVVVAVAGLLGYYFLWLTEVPALDDRTLTAARGELGEDFELVSREEESEEPQGAIISQEPGPGERVRWDSTISVVTSAGLPVPDLIGRTESAAESYTGDDFEIDASSTQNSDEPIGTVFSQDPESGDMASRDSTISVVTSAGLRVPDLIGQTQSSAESETGDDFEIDASGGRVSSEPVGTILDQNREPGDMVTQGSTISVVTSAGQPSNPGDIFRDDFSDTSSGWGRGNTEDGTNDYVNGGYRMTHTLPSSGTTQLISAAGTIEDAVVEVDATNTGDAHNLPGLWGISCRVVNDEGPTNGYSMTISDDGSSNIIKHKDGRLNFLAAGPASDAVRRGSETNHIRGDCVGSKLTLYVNGEKVVEAEDTEFGSGYVGLNVNNYTVGSSDIDILFDNFLVSTP